MKKITQTPIGILGGMSSAATEEYYHLINQKVRQKLGGHHIAEMIIYSVNFAVIKQCVFEENWEEATKYLVDKAQSVERAGASCIFLSTNTMHKVRAEIKKATSIPFIDIFETVSCAIKAENKSKIGMLGTYPVMSDPFYKDAYREYGIELISPDEPQKQEINRIIFDELTRHQFTETSKHYFIEVIQSLVEKGAEGIILGCTEIKLLVNQKDIQEVTLFDTLELHCELASKICTSEIKPDQFQIAHQ